MKKIINSKICQTCPKQKCSGKELNRLGYTKIRCPNYPEEFKLKKVEQNENKPLTLFNYVKRKN